MRGFYNKVLKVNLTQQISSEQEMPDEVFRKCLGGKGLGAHLMLKEIPAQIDPLSAENRLIFTVGPVADTRIWGSSRYGVFAKSPLTGIFGEAYSGGKVAPQIKRTGYDAIVIEGKSDKPVYLEISDQMVEFHDAAHLWGKETYAAEDAILEAVNVEGAQAVVIGPAGENLVRFAVIENNYWRSAGRTGMGTVMGSKNLKGIAFHGRAQCEIADPELLKEIVKKIADKGKGELKAKAEMFQTEGTLSTVEVVNKLGCFPTRYWSEGVHENWRNLSAGYMHENFKWKRHACTSCYLACGKINTVLRGPYKGLTIEGPEYETVYAFGGLNVINSLEEVAYLNDICDRLGMDTMTSGNITAFAIEANKRGKLDFDIDYGRTEKIAELLRLIAARSGVGRILAEGIKEASKSLGLEDLAVHVKGLEPGGFDPRFAKGAGLQYAVSSRGACHMRGTVHVAEFNGVLPPGEVEGKAKLLLDNENHDAFFDCLILCRFYRSWYFWPELADVIRATTGLEMEREDLEKIAMHATTLARTFNVREGVTEKDDKLPKRLLTETLGEKKFSITEEELTKMRKDYYALHGWSEDGVPRKE